MIPAHRGSGRRRVAVCCLLPIIPVLSAVTVSAAEPSRVAMADEAGTITVTGARIEQTEFDIPASVDVIGSGLLTDDRMGINFSEGIGSVPGLIARDRQNYAQDTQISIRGFGSRASFGIRGIRLLLDGIPASQPDGAGQVAHFNLASADRVEILRGPFSTVHGNASGGVIQVFTAPGQEDTRVSVGAVAGSYDSFRSSLGASGQVGSADYNVNYTYFETEGFREHSAAERESFNGKVNFQVGSDGRLSLIANYFDAPDTLDPLGLSRAEFEVNASQATGRATEYNTRKSVEQGQVGAIYEHQLGDASLRLLGYAGNREVEQFLAIPFFVQGGPLTSGGNFLLDNDYVGGDLRWSWEGLINGRRFGLVAGVNLETLTQDRLGFLNFTGTDDATRVLGVRGELRRDETNDVESYDQYLQASLDLSERWSMLAGLRYSKVRFESDDRYIVGENPDDSGRADYAQTSPTVGLTYRAKPGLNFYAAYGRGFETPTFFEVAYRGDGQTGLNLDLEAARSSNTELGAKWKVNEKARANFALFHVATDNEIVVQTSSGGRSTFQNAGRTLRQGAELLLDIQAAPELNMTLAWTLIEARFREEYLACSGIPCFAPDTPVERGNDIPGVADSVFYGRIAWESAEGGWHAGAEARYLDSVAVNDLNVDRAAGYGIVGLDAGYEFRGSWGRLRTFVRVDNLFDEDYVGSVIVNESNGRFFEPGPDLNVLGGFRFDWNV